MHLEPENRGALQTLARNHGWIPADVEITDMEVAGAGNMNRVYRARLSNGTSIVFKQAVPFVARYPDIPAPIERLATEHAIYSTLGTHDKVASAMPKLLGYANDVHLLALEDLGPGADFTHLYQADADTPIVPLCELAAWLGELHSLDVDSSTTLANHSMRELNHEHIFEVPYFEDNGVTLSTALEEAACQLRHNEALMTRIKDLGDVYLHADGPSLLHGDFYPGSWVRDAQDNCRVIDPEFGFLGPPEFDVGVFRAHLLMASLGDEEAEQVLAHYTGRDGISWELVQGFAGAEVIRRLLGVAQLPVPDDDSLKLAWIEKATQWINV